MSRGPGKRQREILRRLELIRCPILADLWHELIGDSNAPWPDPNYRGYHHTKSGQRLSLYSSKDPRSLIVAYRRAAWSLQRSKLVEVEGAPGDIRQRIRVRLPLSERDKIVARVFRRRIGDYARKTAQGHREEVAGPDYGNVKLFEFYDTMGWLSKIDQYPPDEQMPMRVKAIVRQALSGLPVQAADYPLLR